MSKVVEPTPSVPEANATSAESDSETKVVPPAMPALAADGYVLSEGGADPRLRPPLRERVEPQASARSLHAGVDAAMQRLAQDLQKARSNGGITASVVQRLWNECWIESFNEPLSETENPSVKIGEVMPPEIGAVKGNRDVVLDQIRDGTFAYAQSAAEIESAGAMLGLGMGQGMAGGRNLPAMLSGRANELPPAKGDLVAYAVVSAAVREATGDQSALENWRPLVDAKNPVYRLLALEAARYAFPVEARTMPSESPRTSEVVGAQRLLFYREYLDETDPLILATLIDAISKVGSPEARQTLLEMRSRQARFGDQELIGRTDKALAEVNWLINYRAQQSEEKE